jgi:cyclohexyl-isocyanide hydratase
MDGLEIGAIVFPRMDQIDITGPYEVLSRIPGACFQVRWKDKMPARDMKGPILTPETTFAAAPALDVLVAPGNWGQEQLMEMSKSSCSFARRRRVPYAPSRSAQELLCGAASKLRAASLLGWVSCRT